MVPVGYRVKLNKLVDEAPLAGHLGVDKAVVHLRWNFWCPSMSCINHISFSGI